MSALRRIAAVLFRAVADELDPAAAGAVPAVDAAVTELLEQPYALFAPDLMVCVN